MLGNECVLVNMVERGGKRAVLRKLGPKQLRQPLLMRTCAQGQKRVVTVKGEYQYPKTIEDGYKWPLTVENALRG
jgi:hypothetical protein